MHTSEISKEMYRIVKESEIEEFLTMLQNYLTGTNAKNKKYSLSFYRNLPILDKCLRKLSSKEQKLLSVKVNAVIAYLDDINNIHSPSPFIIGVFTAVISLVLGVMIKDFASFPAWTIGIVVICFVLLIPGISWFTLDQSGKNAELKEILTTLKELVE